MTLAEDLRKSVIQSAVLGQLTERIDCKETLIKTLDSIEQRRKELVASKEMKKDKTLFPVDVEDSISDIPDTWKWVRLGSICQKIGAGSTPTGGKAVYVSEGIKFIREQNVHNRGLVLDEVAHIKQDIHNSMKGSQVRAKDLLLNITGASIGRNSLVPDDFDTANINQHVLIIRLVDERMRAYIHYCLMSPVIYSQMMDQQKGDKPGLSAQRVGGFMIPLPPIEEQNEIVKKLETVLPEIDAYEEDEKRLIDLQSNVSRKMTSSILQAAMQGKLTEQLPEDSNVDMFLSSIQEIREGLIKSKTIKRENCVEEIDLEDIPYDIPNTWRWARFADLCALISGSDLTPDRYNNNEKGIPYLTGASNIDSDGTIIINRWVEQPTSQAIRGDLLLTCKGTIGKMAVLEEEKVHIARQIMAVRPFGNVNREYIRYCIMNYINLLNSKAKSMIPGIERANVLNLLIPVPPIEEQQRIVNKLREILPLVDGLQEGIS